MVGSFHRSLAARLFAVWFVALIAFPFTAPFSIVDGLDVGGHAAATARSARTPSTGDISTPQSPQDDDAAVVSVESSSFEQVRLCALFTLPTHDAMTVSSALFDAPARAVPVSHTPARIPLRI